TARRRTARSYASASRDLACPLVLDQSDRGQIIAALRLGAPQSSHYLPLLLAARSERASEFQIRDGLTQASDTLCCQCAFEIEVEEHISIVASWRRGLRRGAAACRLRGIRFVALQRLSDVIDGARRRCV